MWLIPSWAIGVGVIILAVSLGKSLRPLLRAHADRISGRGLPEAEISHFREVLDDVQRRLGELEERLDFAERLLARQRDADRLAPPHS